MKNFFIYFIIISSIFTSNLAFGAVNESTGLITKSVWFSNESFKDGDDIKIYTAIWNGESSKIFVKVEFYDKSVVLGNREIEVLPEEIKEVSIPFNVKNGDHSIYAKIVSSQILNSKGIKEKISLPISKTEWNNITVSFGVEDEATGEVKTSQDFIKDELYKANKSFINIIPESIRTPISNSLNNIENIRKEKLEEVSISKEKAKENVLKLENSEIGEGTEKPIALLRHIFLSALEFILNNKIIFYGLIIFIVFYLIRLIFKKIL
ncbi:TPA: hypothetical protein DIC38_03210 [Candidatus Nomurabacteria bacterium]|nr:MAG: hypothetical protein O210_OD1C00001G0141 [Parcubacteria bacterium RAAC4_OD1_1]HCY26661.1 hypothetical protein [Candidatus Nomurabacteria bacterium]